MQWENINRKLAFFFKEGSRVGFNDDVNASLVMETQLRRLFEQTKVYFTNMCNFNDHYQLVSKKVIPTFGTALA